MIFLPFKSSKGFTLIELLVVIGILGILAAALLQTIDPFEQLKKGRDTVKRNTAIEVLNANIRYYATHSEFPWTVAASPCTTPVAAGSSLKDLTTCITVLQTEGELKTKFTEAVQSTGDDQKIFVNYDAAASTINVCFRPESKSFALDKLTKYGQNGTGAVGCPAVPPAGGCFQCFQ